MNAADLAQRADSLREEAALYVADPRRREGRNRLLAALAALARDIEAEGAEGGAARGDPAARARDWPSPV